MRTLLAVIGTAALMAADANVSGPMLGHTTFQGTIRPVLGVPGAARLGDAVVSGVSMAAVGSAAAYACTDAGLVRIDFAGGERARVAEECPQWIALSPDGKTAVFEDAGSVRVARGAESLAVRVAARACAVDDSGGMLLCAAARGLVRVDVEQGSETAVLVDGRAMAFLRGTRDAVVADGTRMYLLRNGSELSPLASFEAASAVEILGSNDMAVAIDRTGRRLIVAPLDGAQGENLEVPFEPVRIQTVADKNVLLIHGPGEAPPWLLVRQEGAARLMFIPQPEGANE